MRRSYVRLGESVCAHAALLKTKAESALSPFLLTFAAQCGPQQMHDPIVHDRQIFFVMISFVLYTVEWVYISVVYDYKYIWSH